LGRKSKVGEKIVTIIKKKHLKIVSLLSMSIVFLCCGRRTIDIQKKFKIEQSGQVMVNFIDVDGDVYIERHNKNEVLLKLRKKLNGPRARTNLENLKKILPRVKPTKSDLVIEIENTDKNISFSSLNIDLELILTIPMESPIKIDAKKGIVHVTNPQGVVEITTRGKDGTQQKDPSSEDVGLLTNVNSRVASIEAKVNRLTSKMNYMVSQEKNKTEQKPNVILIINESLRSSCLGFNGGDALTPTLDSLAYRGITFKNAISQSGWTTPSITSILTGHYPIAHQKFNRHRINKLDNSMIRLQEIFRASGYYTAAFVGRNFGGFFADVCDRGFLEINISRDDKGGQTVDRVIDFLRNDRVSPYFIFIHIYDPHSPYHPKIPAECPENIENKDSNCAYLNYLREVEELDLQYRRLFDFLDSSPSYVFNPDKDIVIFTADHGEEFIHENGYREHGRSPSIESHHVPLIFIIPNQPARMIDRYCENASIYPTLIDLLDFDLPLSKWKRISPSSLVPIIMNTMKNPLQYSYALSEALYKDNRTPPIPEIKTLIRSDGYKLNYNTKTQEVEIFFLPNDPKEENNLRNDESYLPIFNELYAALNKRTLLKYDYR
jgi:arylsulfatase A-like enzyme